jgi:MYXO-CTERM domain-containing protein
VVGRPRRPLVLAASGAVSAVVGVLVPAEQAEALSCGCVGATQVLAPEHGATEVPVDAFVWAVNAYSTFYYGVAPSELALVGADGEQVEHELRELVVGDAEILIAIPVETLAPDTLYQAFSCSGGVCDRILTEFTTGAGTDDVAPPLPSRGETESFFSTNAGLFSCGRMRALGLGFEHEGILVADLGDAQLDVEALSGSVTAATSDERLFVGVGLCEDLWPGDEDVALGARFGVFDVSGNFSGWTEPEPLELPNRGCSTTDEAPAHWAWGLLLLAWARRRSEVSRR